MSSRNAGLRGFGSRGSIADPMTTPSPSMRAWPRKLLGFGLVLWMVGAVGPEDLVFGGLALCAVGLVAEGGLWADHRRGLVAAAALIAVLMLSALWAPRPLRGDVPWSALHVLFFPVAMLAWARVDDRQRRAVLFTFVLLSVASAALAIAQHYHQFQYPAWLAKIAPTYRMTESAPAPFTGWKGGGLHFHRLKYAHTALPLVLAAAYVLRGWFSTTVRKLVGVAFALLLIASFASTFARAVFVALVAASIAGLLAARLPPRLRGGFALAIFVGGMLVPVLFALIDRGPADRLIAWHSALQLISEHPIFGVGYGGYRPAALVLLGGVEHPTWNFIHYDAHAIGLQIAAEGGLLALLASGWALACYASLGAATTAPQVAIVAAWSVLGVTHNLPYHPVVVAAFGLSLAMAQRLRGPSPAS